MAVSLPAPAPSSDIYTPIKDKASALLNAYQETHTEIVKGYEDGTRVQYVVDMDTEELYRKATMEGFPYGSSMRDVLKYSILSSRYSCTRLWSTAAASRALRSPLK